MNENQIVTAVLDEAIMLHKKLGPGLLESVYEAALSYERRKKGFEIKQQTESHELQTACNHIVFFAFLS